MKKGYWIGHITVTNPEAYRAYVERDTPVIEGHGGRFLVRGGRAEVPEGTVQERHVVIEFPSYAAAVTAYEDPAYQEIAQIRKDNARSVVVIVEGA